MEIKPTPKCIHQLPSWSVVVSVSNTPFLTKYLKIIENISEWEPKYCSSDSDYAMTVRTQPGQENVLLSMQSIPSVGSSQAFI
jgi:hypothetical protein